MKISMIVPALAALFCEPALAGDCGSPGFSVPVYQSPPPSAQVENYRPAFTTVECPRCKRTQTVPAPYSFEAQIPQGGLAQGLPQAFSQSMPQPSLQALPQAMPQAMPQVMPQAMPQPTLQAIPQAMPQAMPQPNMQGMPQVMPQAIPQPTIPQPNMQSAPPVLPPQVLPQAIPQVPSTQGQQAFPQNFPMTANGMPLPGNLSENPLQGLMNFFSNNPQGTDPARLTAQLETLRELGDALAQLMNAGNPR